MLASKPDCLVASVDDILDEELAAPGSKRLNYILIDAAKADLRGIIRYKAHFLTAIPSVPGRPMQDY